MTAPTWPDPNAPRSEVDAFVAEHQPTPPTGPQHEAPEVSNGPSLMCNACGVVRVGLFPPFCQGCIASCPELAGP